MPGDASTWDDQLYHYVEHGESWSVGLRRRRVHSEVFYTIVCFRSSELSQPCVSMKCNACLAHAHDLNGITHGKSFAELCRLRTDIKLKDQRCDREE